MIVSCNKCGGLKATEHLESFAGTPCRCADLAPAGEVGQVPLTDAEKSKPLSEGHAVDCICTRCLEIAEAEMRGYKKGLAHAAPAGELVSREAVNDTIIAAAARHRRHARMAAAWALEALPKILAALPPVARVETGVNHPAYKIARRIKVEIPDEVARVPVVAEELADEIVRELRLDFRLDDNRIRIAKAIAAIIESHCGSVTPTQKDSGSDA